MRRATGAGDRGRRAGDAGRGGRGAQPRGRPRPRLAGRLELGGVRRDRGLLRALRRRAGADPDRGRPAQARPDREPGQDPRPGELPLRQRAGRSGVRRQPAGADGVRAARRGEARLQPLRARHLPQPDRDRGRGRCSRTSPRPPSSGRPPRPERRRFERASAASPKAEQIGSRQRRLPAGDEPGSSSSCSRRRTQYGLSGVPGHQRPQLRLHRRLRPATRRRDPEGPLQLPLPEPRLGDDHGPPRPRPRRRRARARDRPLPRRGRRPGVRPDATARTWSAACP